MHLWVHVCLQPHMHGIQFKCPLESPSPSNWSSEQFSYLPANLWQTVPGLISVIGWIQPAVCSYVLLNEPERALSDLCSAPSCGWTLGLIDTTPSALALQGPVRGLLSVTAALQALPHRLLLICFVKLKCHPPQLLEAYGTQCESW